MDAMAAWEFLPRIEPYRQSKLYANCQSYFTIVILTEMPLVEPMLVCLAVWDALFERINLYSYRFILT